MAEARMLPPAPRRASGLLLGGLALGIVIASSLILGLAPADLVPHAGGLDVARDFFGAALYPTLEYESDFVASDDPPLLTYALEALGRTAVFALAALGLALVGGSFLAFLASSAWWAPDTMVRPGPAARILGSGFRPALHVAARALAVALRSVHEIIWALLFLLSFGLSDFAAVLAIALPFAGFVAKVFGEILEEVPREPAEALRASGAGGLQTFVCALVAPALPELLSYVFYRFECALRSSAVLGFFGYATIGLRIRQSFVSSYYRETWTYLWILLATVVLLDVISGHLRRRLRG